MKEQTPTPQEENIPEDTKPGRVVGLDVHPDLFTAAVMTGRDPATAKVSRLYDKVPLPRLEDWARKHLRARDVVVLEATGNSFEVALRLADLGIRALVLESQRAGQIRKSYCTTDKISAVKLGRIYLSGLAQIVWQPDPQSRERREVFLAHKKAVTTCTRLRNRIKSYLSDHCVRLGKGARLTQPCGRARALEARAWTPMQRTLLEEMFQELSGAELRRRKLRAVMAREILSDAGTLRLLRLMGVRHVVAFGLMAVIGDIRRFATPKKLVAYLGLIPCRWQSGNTSHPGGLSRHGRGDVRNLLIQSAHNAMNHPGHPLHKWGWKLMLRKGHRNVAIAAIARKIAVSAWYLLNGFFSPLSEADATLRIKIHKLATALGMGTIKEMGYQSKKAFEEEKIQWLLNTA